ncbi:uncharacterized protein TNIN_445991 [Trichonephila inaurata madagascariensis]|uniref:Uncharacterized protein n=1 Tax=Trichonephila inaurata madagascariensis TaxID=2747483 RepID=A0A8X6Y2F5_9ARAC|nr:uncharacterized protein TNIN_445991 [Trichonephila inaurata madagascariensis]
MGDGEKLLGVSWRGKCEQPGFLQGESRNLPLVGVCPGIRSMRVDSQLRKRCGICQKRKIIETPTRRAKNESSKIIDERSVEASVLEPFQDNDSESESSELENLLDKFEDYDSDDENQSSSPEVDWEDVNGYLEGNVGDDINAKKWLEGCSGLDNVEKSEVIIRLIYEIFLVENTECDPENNVTEKENNKAVNFDPIRVFELIVKVNRFFLAKDRRKLVEVVCLSSNVILLEMICQREMKDARHTAWVHDKYPWKGEFTGYETLTDLLQYVLDQRCSPHIVRCIAEKVFGWPHNVLNGRKYLTNFQIQNMEDGLNQKSSVVSSLKTAIGYGYTDTVLVMLSGDVYHCIYLMKEEIFQKERRFREALDVIKETVANVMGSWAKELCKNEVKDLLTIGIEIDIEKKTKKDLIDELEYHEIVLSEDEKESRERLVKRLYKELGAKVRLRRTVVGALISTLFFNYRNELVKLLIEKKPFKLGILPQDKIAREKQIEELNRNVYSKKLVQEKVLKSIELLNSSSHLKHNWFFREVLEKVVNENLDKLRAVCVTLCKGPMEELLNSEEANENSVKPSRIKTSPKIDPPRVNIASRFLGDIESLVKAIKGLKDSFLIKAEILMIARGLVRGEVPFFSGLSRRTIINLKNKTDKTDSEAKDLKKNVFMVMEKIKRRIYILGNGGDRIDAEDIFHHFKVINSELERKHKREIVELVCRSDNVMLLEMICEHEMKDAEQEARMRDKHLKEGKLIRTIINILMEDPIELLYDLSFPMKTKILKFFGIQPLRLDAEKSIVKKPQNSIESSSVPLFRIEASKAKSKVLMQNYEITGESYDASGSHCYLNTPNNSLKIGTMVNKDSQEKLLLSTTPKLNELITPDLPEIDHLMEVFLERYKQRLLDNIFDFGTIASHPYLQCSGRILENLSPMNRSRYLDFSHLGNEDIAVIESYEKGISLLKLGLEKKGKKEIMRTADKGLPHASYVCALITFKEVVQFNNGKSKFPPKNINGAVQYMQCVKQEFFPLPSFILGIMQTYNQIFVDDQVTSARQCFMDVLRGIKCSESNHCLVVPRKYIVMEDESNEYFKWIVQASKYELARDMLLHSEDLSSAKSLFRELSLGAFVDAKCLYALALLKNAFRDVEIFKKENFVHAYGLLQQAVDSGHKDAMFFFGTLPFRHEFMLLDKESRIGKGKASEYVKERGSYVTYDEEKAKIILKEYNCLRKLEELEKNLQKRRENILPNVLSALKQVHSELKKNEVLPSQPMSSAVKELLDALQGSTLNVQSPLLQPILKLLHLTSTSGLRFLLLPLQQLCEVLKSEVESQSHCSEILTPLQNLLSTCFELQIERGSSILVYPLKLCRVLLYCIRLQAQKDVVPSRVLDAIIIIGLFPQVISWQEIVVSLNNYQSNRMSILVTEELILTKILKLGEKPKKKLQ